MRLALVHEAPRPSARTSTEYLRRTVEACAAAAGVAVEAVNVFAVPDAQPGGKSPPLALVRAERAGLMQQLAWASPDAVVSLGSTALRALHDQATLKAEHGRMRWLELPCAACDHDHAHPELRVPMTPTVAPWQVVKNPDLHRDLAGVIYKAVTQGAPLEPMSIDTRVCRTVKELRASLSLLEGASVVAVDVETTGLSPYRDLILAVGIGGIYDDSTGVAVIVPSSLLLRPGTPDLLWDAVWRRSRRTVGHNFKFDMQFLQPLVGWAPEGARLGDTLLLAHLLDERPPVFSRARGSGLKDLVAQRYDHQYGFDFDQFYADGMSSEDEWARLYRYLGEDVCYTARLWFDLEREADEESPRLMDCHDATLVPASLAIARCELAGAPVDVPWVVETVVALGHRTARSRRVLEGVLPSLATTTVVDNVLSPTQVADLMYDEWDMTPKLVKKHGVYVLDDRSTDKSHIEAAVAKYLHCGDPARERQARWLRGLERLRKDEKVRTTYQQSILDRVDDDGRLRASFLLHGTSTGRLSSREPNLQNVPAVKRMGSSKYRPMRRAFRAGAGRSWVEVDYSQLELRVAAGISGDQAMAEVFRSGRDVHREIASAIFSRQPEDISDAERFLAKAVSFGIIYGRSARALAGGVEMDYARRELGMVPWTEEQAEAFIGKFMRTYPDLERWIAATHADVPARGYVESPFGRRRRFPLRPQAGSELRSVERQAVNTPVQSAASDICLRAMVRLAARVDRDAIDAAVLFPVHDSICLECADDALGTLEAACRDVMEEDFMGVPLTVDFEWGPDWAHMSGSSDKMHPTSGSHGHR